MFGFLHKEVPAPAPELTPQQQLQQEIDNQTLALHVASKSLADATEYARKCDRDKSSIEADIKIIQHRLESAADPAMSAKLVQRNAQLADVQKQCDTANASIEQGKKSLDDFHQNIEGIKTQGQELNIQLNLAHSDEAAADLKAQLSGFGSGNIPNALDKMKQQLAASKATVSTDRLVTVDSEKAKEDEYLK